MYLLVFWGCYIKASWDRAKGSRSNLIGVDGRKLVGVQGKPLKLYGSTCVQVQLAAEKFSVEVIIAETPTADHIIGRDFLRRQECTIEMGEANDILHVKSRKLKLPVLKGQAFSVSPMLSVTLPELVKVPPPPLSAKWRLWLVSHQQLPTRHG